MIRIGILSDTHLTVVSPGLRNLLDTVFRDVDAILHAGDMTSMEVYDYLARFDLRAVRGNMDDFDLKAILPETRIEEWEGKKVGIIHGRGGPYGIEDLVLREFHGVDVVVFGHSHVPLNTAREGTLLFNPGSFRGSSRHPGSVGVMEIDETIRLRHVKVE